MKNFFGIKYQDKQIELAFITYIGFVIVGLLFGFIDSEKPIEWMKAFWPSFAASLFVVIALKKR